MSKDTMIWAARTFKQSKLGDKRRTERLITTVAALADHAGSTIAGAFGHDDPAMQGAYRFVRSRKIDTDAIMEAGFEATAQRAAGHNLMVLAQDTTTLGYSHCAAERMGDIGAPRRSRKRGVHVHSCLLMDADDSTTIGLVDQQYWMRKHSNRGKSKDRRETDYKDKESYKWETGFDNCAGRLAGLMQRVITVCDSEGDVYENLSHALGKGRRFVIRACQDRRVEENGLLWGYMGTQEVKGGAYVDIQQKGGRAARRARVEIRSALVKVDAPRRFDGSRLEPIELWCVRAREVDAPKGAQALEWMLWTTQNCGQLCEALEVIRYYRLRWRVEDFHWAWKEGCGVEKQRLEDCRNLLRLAVMLSFVAVRLLQIREWGKGEQRRCDEVLDSDEWRVLWASVEKKKALPKEAPTMKWAYYAIAKLGGWRDTKRTGRVGMEAMWKGLMRLQDMVQAWRLALRFAEASKM